MCFNSAFLEVFDFKGLAIVSSVMGFLKTLVFLPTPLVLAEYLSKERYAHVKHKMTIRKLRL